MRTKKELEADFDTLIEDNVKLRGNLATKNEIIKDLEKANEKLTNSFYGYKEATLNIIGVLRK